MLELSQLDRVKTVMSHGPLPKEPDDEWLIEEGLFLELDEFVDCANSLADFWDAEGGGINVKYAKSQKEKNSDLLKAYMSLMMCHSDDRMGSAKSGAIAKKFKLKPRWVWRLWSRIQKARRKVDAVNGNHLLLDAETMEAAFPHTVYLGGAFDADDSIP